jgi:transketolase
VIIATGSEVQLALHAQAAAGQGGIAVRVVSMPSTTVFDRQDKRLQEGVLPAKLPRVAVEAGVTDGWWKYGCAAVLGMDRFGESAPAAALFKHFGTSRRERGRRRAQGARPARARSPRASIVSFSTQEIAS